MVKKRWLEIILKVNGELAEAVAEVLDRFVYQGVVIERIIPQESTSPADPADGDVRVVGYLAVDEKTEESRIQIEQALWHLGQIMPLPAAEYKTIEDEDWMVAWKKNYHPVLVGNRLQIVPSWMEPPDPDRISIRINPSMAFGTGTHPSTQLCLEHLEAFVIKGEPIIDVGCGSGILSIAAIKLSASHALAMDIDEQAVRNTKENIAINDIDKNIEVGLGSVQEIREKRFSIFQAPVVVVNILAPVIVLLFHAGLSDLVERDGKLILAGILDEQFANVDQAAKENGFKLVEKLNKADWVSPVYKRIG